MQKIIFFIFILSIPLQSISQIAGEYRTWNSIQNSWGFGSIFTLHENQTFSYSGSTSVVDFDSQGKWKLDGDTLILNSDFQMNNWPIVVKDSIDRTSVDSIQFWVFDEEKHLCNEPPFPTLIINLKDTITSHNIYDGGGGYFSIPTSASLESIQIEYSDYWRNVTQYTIPYPVKNKDANHFEIQIFFSSYYIVFTEEKYYRDKDTLFQYSHHPEYGTLKQYYVRKKP